MDYSAEREALGKWQLEPALKTLAAAHRQPGQLHRAAQELEDELVTSIVAAWREIYLTGRLLYCPAHLFAKACELCGFLIGFSDAIMPPARRENSEWAPLTDAEIDSLLVELGRDLHSALAQGRKLSEQKLLAAGIASQRKLLARLLNERSELDEQDRMASFFMRAKDGPTLSDIYAARLGERRPLLTALEEEDWDEILRLWLRGWRPAVEAAKIRLAARIDGAPRGGALDFVTSY